MRDNDNDNDNTALLSLDYTMDHQQGNGATADDRMFQTPAKMNGNQARNASLHRVQQHPLLSTDETITDNFASIEPSSSVDTAMLLQSAARSVLDTDNASPSTTTAVSEDGSGYNDRSSVVTDPDNTTLQSLQTKTLPALPDEQDRKRFVVCID